MALLPFSALAVIAYLIFLLVFLTAFNIFCRQRQTLLFSNVEEWFPNHHERNIYLTLLHFENPQCPKSLLKAALFERAKEDIRRIYSLKDSKRSANELMKRGEIAEPILKQLDSAESALEYEIQDVISEATGLGGEQWGKTIFAQANEYYQRKIILRRIKLS